MIEIIKYNIRTMVVAFLATTMAAGCVSHGDEPVPEPLPGSTTTPGQQHDEPGQPMNLAAKPYTASRADKSPLEEIYNDFGVWAWKTNPDATVQTVLSRNTTTAGQSAYYTRWITGDKWTYEYTAGSINQYLHYWDPATAHYNFVAYAPYFIADVPAASLHDIEATPGGRLSISAINGNIAASTATDWLEARWKRTNSTPVVDTDLYNNTDYSTSALTVTVPLVFHHIMPITEFRIFSDSSLPVGVTSINISLADGDDIVTSADYVDGSWTPTGDSASQLYSHDGTAIDLTGVDKKHAYQLNRLVQIPQNVVGKKINITIKRVDDSEISTTFTLLDGWNSEKVYIYYIKLNPSEPILVETEIETNDWEKGDEIEADDVTNW